MQHHHDGAPVLTGQRMQQFKDFHLIAEVKKRCRLVEQDMGRLLRQRHRNPAALTLAAGKAFHRQMGKLRRTGQAQCLFHGLLVFVTPLAHKILPGETPARNQFKHG